MRRLISIACVVVGFTAVAITAVIQDHISIIDTTAYIAWQELPIILLALLLRERVILLETLIITMLIIVLADIYLVVTFDSDTSTAGLIYIFLPIWFTLMASTLIVVQKAIELLLTGRKTAGREKGDN